MSDKTWNERVRDMLHRLETMQPPNVILQQITMLGEARDLLREATSDDGEMVYQYRLHHPTGQKTRWGDIDAESYNEIKANKDNHWDRAEVRTLRVVEEFSR